MWEKQKQKQYPIKTDCGSTMLLLLVLLLSIHAVDCYGQHLVTRNLQFETFNAKTKMQKIWTFEAKTFAFWVPPFLAKPKRVGEGSTRRSNSLLGVIIGTLNMR